MGLQLQVAKLFCFLSQRGPGPMRVLIVYPHGSPPEPPPKGKYDAERRRRHRANNMLPTIARYLATHVSLLKSSDDSEQRMSATRVLLIRRLFSLLNTILPHSNAREEVKDVKHMLIDSLTQINEINNTYEEARLDPSRSKISPILEL